MNVRGGSGILFSMKKCIAVFCIGLLIVLSRLSSAAEPSRPDSAVPLDAAAISEKVNDTRQSQNIAKEIRRYERSLRNGRILLVTGSILLSIGDTGIIGAIVLSALAWHENSMLSVIYGMSAMLSGGIGLHFAIPGAVLLVGGVRRIRRAWRG